MIDKSSILQILGSLMRRPSILAQTDKYHLDITDFSDRLDKFTFAAIENLYRNGAAKIAPIDIENYLETNDTARSVFERENGIEYLQDAEYLADETNFEVYYKRLKKFNLLRSLSKSGIDTSEFYNENLADPKAIETNEQFEYLTIEDIINRIKARVLNLERKFSENDVTETETAFEGMDEILTDAMEGNDIGLPLQGQFFNEVVSGARTGALYIRSAGSGTGKALPNSTIIPTPIGPRRVDEIQVGDYLFDAFGKPTKVLGVYPQGRKEVNFVRFKDGRVSLCCEDHLWSYCTAGQKDWAKKERKFYTKTLKELKTERMQNSDGGYRILVPMQYAVEYPKKEFYIPPYVFGLALGDGSFRQHSSNKAFSYSSEDEYLPNYIANEMGWIAKHNCDNNYTWYFATEAHQSNQFSKINVWVEDFLREYPELINATSKDKFIPDNYLRGSIEQRFELLNGLLDSDGSVDEKGRVTFFTISPKLRDNVVELCHSLGLKTSVLIDTHKTTNIGYAVTITGRPEDKNKLFKLPRKRQRMEAWYNNTARKELNDFNPIIEIGSCGYTEEMTCFYVDNEEHLFLTEDYIVTHNTRQAVGDACYLAYPVRYDGAQWRQTGSCQKVLFIATEQDFKEIRKMILSYLTNINEARFRYGDFTTDEQKVIQQALEVMEEYKDNFYIVRMPNPTIELVQTLVRENCLLHDIHYVFYDYIFIGPSLIGEFKGVQLRHDELLLLFANALKNLAVELSIFIMTATQLNANGDNNQTIRGESALAGGRATINKADVGVIIARPTQEELDAFHEAHISLVPNMCTDIFKVRSGQWTQVRIWSYVDLGTLRKKDLFVTDARLQLIEDFRVVTEARDWDENSYKELLERLNNG